MSNITSGNKTIMTPAKLKGLLVALLLLLFAGGAALFWFTYRELQSYGAEVAAKHGEAEASNNSLSTIQATKVFLDNNTSVIDQVNRFTLQSDLPQFQIRKDIMHYADLRGVGVDAVEFSSGANDTTGTNSGTTTAPASPAPNTSITSPPATAAASNLVSVTVKFESEVNYTAFLKFLHDIEHNLPKMTVEKVNITKGGDDDSVKVEPILVNTYITP